MPLFWGIDEYTEVPLSATVVRERRALGSPSLMVTYVARYVLRRRQYYREAISSQSWSVQDWVSTKQLVEDSGTSQS